MSQSDSNAFPVCYRIGGVAIGGQSLSVSLIVDPFHRTVSGSGLITRAVNPGNSIRSQLHGTYRELEVGPDGRSVIQLFATGFPPALVPIGPFQPLQFPNVELWMTLETNWDGVVASYKSRETPDGSWHDIDNVPVEKVDCFEA